MPPTREATSKDVGIDRDQCSAFAWSSHTLVVDACPRRRSSADHLAAHAVAARNPPWPDATVLLCPGAAALTFPLHSEPLPRLAAVAPTLDVLDAASGQNHAATGTTSTPHRHHEGGSSTTYLEITVLVMAIVP
jgi:hypothetical protein